MKKFISMTLTFLLVVSLLILPSYAADAIKDLQVGKDYSEAVELNGENAGRWGNHPKINMHIQYQFAISDEGLKIKITIPTDELELNAAIQINFNPSMKLSDDDLGLFLGITTQEDNKVKFTQHNHKTKLEKDPNPGGVEITLDYNVSTVETNHVIELTVPVSFFQIEEVTDDFEFNEETELGYMLFCVETVDGTRVASSFEGMTDSFAVKDLDHKKLTFPAEVEPTEEPEATEAPADDKDTDKEKEGLSGGVIAAIVIVAIIVVAVIVFFVTKKKE